MKVTYLASCSRYCFPKNVVEAVAALQAIIMGGDDYCAMLNRQLCIIY